ncbi:3-deoxy-manno-octulosonate cytidylyltransferase (CMP-KDO synthetase) [Phycisphaerales bacterium]|nr:3-deoxy-manno-octulosonate cytidylyltransferase (CMP-KDO synthetase) [Phycisphaerales bacterium]
MDEHATSGEPGGEVVAIIPARLGSTRFPGKVLADRTGWPLIRHVWERTRRAESVSRVVVATDSEAVRSAVAGFGGEVVMTRADHPNGTSRLAEAAAVLRLRHFDIVVNVQGDEPEIEPGAVDAAVGALRASGAEAATVGSPFAPGEDPANPNIVKVVVRRDGSAMYFSRSLIPHPRSGGTAMAPLKHVGMYVYRVSVLRRYVELPPSPLEMCEMLEQLRLLDHGYRMAVAVREVRTSGIDTPEQYEAFVARWKRGA